MFSNQRFTQSIAAAALALVGMSSAHADTAPAGTIVWTQQPLATSPDCKPTASGGLKNDLNKFDPTLGDTGISSHVIWRAADYTVTADMTGSVVIGGLKTTFSSNGASPAPDMTLDVVAKMTGWLKGTGSPSFHFTLTTKGFSALTPVAVLEEPSAHFAVYEFGVRDSKKLALKAPTNATGPISITMAEEGVACWVTWTWEPTLTLPPVAAEPATKTPSTGEPVETGPSGPISGACMARDELAELTRHYDHAEKLHQYLEALKEVPVEEFTLTLHDSGFGDFRVESHGLEAEQWAIALAKIAPMALELGLPVHLGLHFALDKAEKLADELHSEPMQAEDAITRYRKLIALKKSWYCAVRSALVEMTAVAQNVTRLTNRIHEDIKNNPGPTCTTAELNTLDGTLSNKALEAKMGPLYEVYFTSSESWYHQYEAMQSHTTGVLTVQGMQPSDCPGFGPATHTEMGASPH